MRVDTSILFQILIRTQKPELVCDVGSLDGDRACRFRSLLPQARVVAFEANPINARAMREDARHRNAAIELRDEAASDLDGHVRFFVEHVGANTACRGMSSTRRRSEEYRLPQEPIQTEVPAVRLETFVLGSHPIPATIALWIDAEGAAFEVLSGIERIRDRVQVVHVEVEEREVWYGQKVKGEVVGLMQRLGFRELARGLASPQYDVVFVPAETTAGSKARYRCALAVASVLSLVRRHRIGAWMLRTLARAILGLGPSSVLSRRSG